MHCSKCGADNREGAKFCNECGTRLGNNCAACGALNQPEAKFCDECGAALAGAVITKAAEIVPVAHPIAGERRHLTVLFCDLVGSTAIAARLDPEEWREIVASYHRVSTDAITRFGGYVAQYLGDGLMAYFGWPEAHDNDAERAARAGLAILEAIEPLNLETTQAKLAARVGIHSGAVVVGSSPGKDADVFGDAPNIAARVQGVAEPDTVVVTAQTHRLISGLFVIEDRGAQQLKGLERPMQLYRVIRPSGVRGRLEAVAAARGLTPFIGREDELRLLLNRWERVHEGEGQVVALIGEAGIGKSRLVRRFREEIARAPHILLEYAAAPFHQNTPFYAVADMLRQGFDWQQKFAAFEAALQPGGIKSDQAARQMAPSELPAPANYLSSAISPEQQHKQLLASLVTSAFGAAQAQPLVIVTEDLHWADPSTLELMHLLAEQGATVRLLLLYTARPEFHPPWPLRAHHTQLNLNRLSARNVRSMVQEIAARNALAEETVTAVVERTGGVPLFVEELTQAVLESGSEIAGREIPATLHDSLMARLDRLGPAKEAVQIGAVIGLEFSYELMLAVHLIGEDELTRALRAASEAELLYVRGIVPSAMYQFKHALIRDVAYESLLKSHRRDLHRRVAETIDEKFPALKREQPEVLARHWTEAGENQQAVAQWSRAGEAAEVRGSFNEARENYQQALHLLSRLPESAERDARELQFRTSLYTMLWRTRGPSAPQTLEAVSLVTALAEKSGNLELVVGLMVNAGLSALLTSRETGAIVALADQALELATREGSPRTLVPAHSLQVQAHFFLGDLAAVEEHFAAEMKLAKDPGIRKLFSSSTLLQDLFTAAMSAWMLGRADLARRRFGEMVALTDANNPWTVAMSQFFTAEFHFALKEYQQAEVSGLHALELSEKYQLAFLIAACRCSLGKVRSQLGRASEGVALLRRGIADALELGLGIRTVFNKTWLALAQSAQGMLDDAFQTLEQAVKENTDDPAALLMALLLRGELWLRKDHSRAAEADFREALTLARSMGAKMLELKVIMCHARLLANQGRRDDARTMLADIYSWFNEGFDLLELKEAKSLFDELS